MHAAYEIRTMRDKIFCEEIALAKRMPRWKDFLCAIPGTAGSWNRFPRCARQDTLRGVVSDSRLHFSRV